MAHYAFLDEDNIVTEVIVGRNEDETVDGVSDWEYHSWSIDDINKYIPENLVERYALVDIVSYMEAEEAVA